jgi:hypothetical protein
MKIDFEKTTVVEFELIQRIRQAIVCGQSVPELSVLLSEVHEVICWDSQETVLNQLYLSLLNHYLFYIRQEMQQANMEVLLRLYQQFYHFSLPLLPLGHTLSQIEVTSDRLWPSVVGAEYRYTSSNFFSRFFFGAHIMVGLSVSKDLLLCYWLVSCLYNAPIDDIPQMWREYLNAYQRLLDHCDKWYANSWFWHLGVRKILIRLKTKAKMNHQQVLRTVRQRFDLEDQYEAVLGLVPVSGVVGEFLPSIFTEAERLTFGLRLQVYHPVEAVIYKHMQSEPLSEEEVGLLGQAPALRALAVIKGKTMQLYQYQKYIQKVCKKSCASMQEIIQSVFKQTVKHHSDFWYQFEDYVTVNDHPEYANLIGRLVNEWYYKKPEVSKMGFTRLEVSRIYRDSYVVAYSAYDACVSIEHAEFVLGRLYSAFSIDAKIDFKTYQSLSLIWSSVYQMLQTPGELTVSFTNAVKQLLVKHERLQPPTRLYLQSYMAILAKYIWLQRWPKLQVRDAIAEVIDSGGPSWNKGMLAIVHSTNQQSQQQKEQNGEKQMLNTDQERRLA